MKLIKDEKSIWDIEKEIMFDKVEEGIFQFSNLEIGKRLNQEWWKLIDDNGKVLGFGWVNYEHGDFEISLVVDKESRESGLGTFIVEQLEQIARENGYNETLAIIKHSNNRSSSLIGWFYRRGYAVYVGSFEGMKPVSEKMASCMVKHMDVNLRKKIV